MITMQYSEQADKLPYWCKVAFVVELYVGRVVQAQGYILQGQQRRQCVIDTKGTTYTKQGEEHWQPLQA